MIRKGVKIEQSNFYKQQICRKLSKALQYKPFEQYLPFDANIINIHDGDQDYCDQPLLLHPVISVQQLLFPYLHFTEEQLQLFKQKFMAQKQSEGIVRIFMPESHHNNNIIVYKDFELKGTQLLEICGNTQQFIEIQRPILGDYLISALFMEKGTNVYEIWMDHAKTGVKRITIENIEDHNQQQLSQYFIKSTQKVQQILLENIYLRHILTLSFPQLTTNLAISKSKHNFILSLTFQNKNYSKSLNYDNQKDRLKVVLSSLKYFHQQLNLSVGCVSLNWGKYPFLFNFKSICEGSLELYAYDIVHILSILLQNIKEAQLIKSIQNILEIGDDQEIVQKYKELVIQVSKD